MRAGLIIQTDKETKNMDLYDFLSNSRTDKDLNKVLAALQKSSNAAAYEILNAVADSSSKDQLDSFLPTLEHIIEKYPTTGRKKALIINVLKNRKGAEKDTTALTETLQRCGFQVVSCSNFTEKGILDNIEKFKEDLVGVTCCLVAVMSHGTSAYEFLTQDDLTLHLKKDIVNEFSNAKCRELRNMPKIFLANFCRGDRVDFECTDFGNESKTETDSAKLSFVETDTTGSFSDILICHGTYDDHYAYRTEDGTWYIQSFCKIMTSKANGQLDFLDIMNLVFKEVNEKVTD